MSTVTTNALRNLSSFLQDHQVSFSNMLLILFTMGGEQIFKISFKCPSTHPEAYIYSLVVMFVPAIILLLIGIAVSNLTWRICHGCRKREATQFDGYRHSCIHIAVVVARSAIVPCAWIFMALVDGNYFACMNSNTPGDPDSADYKYFKWLSQIISWGSLGLLILIAFIVICLYRYCDSVTYEQNKLINAYREAEQKKLDAAIEKYTEKLAETNVEAFMKEKGLKKKDWDEIARTSGVLIEKIPKKQLQGPTPAREGTVPPAEGATSSPQGMSTVLPDGAAAAPSPQGMSSVLPDGAAPSPQGMSSVLPDGAAPSPQGAPPVLPSGAAPFPQGAAPVLPKAAALPPPILWDNDSIIFFSHLHKWANTHKEIEQQQQQPPPQQNVPTTCSV